MYVKNKNKNLRLFVHVNTRKVDNIDFDCFIAEISLVQLPKPFQDPLVISYRLLEKEMLLIFDLKSLQYLFM